MKKLTFDTNALMHNPFFLQGVSEDTEIVIPYIVLKELDKIKMDYHSVRGFQARRAVRVLKALQDRIVFDLRTGLDNGLYDPNNDDRIIHYAYKTGAVLVTGDFLAQLRAKALGVEAIALDEITNQDAYLDYTGVRELYFDTTKDDDNYKLADLYESYGKGNNTLGLRKNEYLVMWDLSKPTYNDDGVLTGYEPIKDAQYKFDGKSISKLSYKKLDNFYSEKITPRNVKQKCVFDMLQDRNTAIKAVFGGFGVGKDYLMISHVIDLLHKGKIDKLIWVRNNVEVKDSNPIGFLPDGMTDKLLPFAMPLADHVGGIDGLKLLMTQGKIEIQHLGFIRGRDIKNSIIYVTECENNTKEHMQLLIGRVGENSQLWVNGDTKQIDDDKFTFNNGVNAMKKLGGQDLYGQVTLDKVERSETARMADLLD